MKTRILFILLAGNIALSCYGQGQLILKPVPTCGMASLIPVDPELKLENFGAFIDQATGKPLYSLQPDTHRIYSPDHRFYFELTGREGTLLNSEGGALAITVPLAERKIIWTDNCVILHSLEEENVISLVSGKTSSYYISKKGAWFSYLGQTDQAAYFSSLMGKNNTIFSLDSSGMKIILDTTAEHIYSYRFYNPQLSIRSEPVYKGKMAVADHTTFTVGGKTLLSTDSLAYQCGFFYKGTTYVSTGKRIYKMHEGSLEKVFDFNPKDASEWIYDFKIEDDKLVFRANGHYYPFSQDTMATENGLSVEPFSHYNVIGIVNLDTKEVLYPKINL